MCNLIQINNDEDAFENECFAIFHNSRMIEKFRKRNSSDKTVKLPNIPTETFSQKAKRVAFY